MTEFMPRVNWDHDETKELIKIWADDVIQVNLASSAHKTPIYDTIAAELRRKNFNRTGLQCKQRIAKLKYDYKRCCADIRKR